MHFLKKNGKNRMHFETNKKRSPKQKKQTTHIFEFM